VTRSVNRRHPTSYIAENGIPLSGGHLKKQSRAVLIEIAALVFQYHQRMLPAADEEIEKRSLSIESICQHHIEGSARMLEHAGEQAQSTGDFIFPRALRFRVQQEAQGLAARGGAGQQHQGHMAVIVLDALLAGAGDRALQAGGAMTPIAGMAFVTVQNGHGQAMLIGQSFVSLETEINLPNRSS